MNVFRQVLSVHVVQLHLTRRSRVLFVLATVVPALFLSFEAGLSTSALTLAESGHRHAVRQALTLDPENPVLQDRLGLDYLDGVEETDASASLRHLRRAVELAPARAFYWVDLASACESRSDFTCAGGALQHALSLAPMTPRLYWMAANYDLRRSQSENAAPLFRKLLELSPDYALPTFDVCLRVQKDPNFIRQQVMPTGGHPSLRLSYVDFLSALDRMDLASQAWGDVIQIGSRFPFSLAQSYFDLLIDSRRVEQAACAWQDLERLGVIGAASDGNLAYNGGFEQAPLNAGFDWHYQPVPYITANFAEAAAYEGRRCLRLDFMGTNSDFEPVFEWVPVAPNRRYLLTAQAKSDSISSDSGPRLRMVDADCPACLDMSSDMAVGTTPWHQMSIRFATSAETHLLKLSIWRPHSRTFPTEITGHFWLGAVRLTAEPVPAIASLKPAS